MEEGYVEFKDVAKITGFSKGLAYIAESFNVIEEYRKTTFPHKFATLDHLNYVGDVPSTEYWEGNAGRIPDEFLSILPK